MTIKFYNMTEEKIKVVKTLPDVPPLTSPAILKAPCSLFRPVFNFEFDTASTYLPSYNYLYAVELNRYYFIDEITAITNTLYQFQCTCDVLMTYANTIKNVNAMVSRNENEFDSKIIDNLMPISNNISSNITSAVGDAGNTYTPIKNVTTGNHYVLKMVLSHYTIYDGSTTTEKLPDFGVSYLWCTKENVQNIISSMISDTPTTQLSQYILGLYYLPVTPSYTSNENVTNIKIQRSGREQQITTMGGTIRYIDFSQPIDNEWTLTPAYFPNEWWKRTDPYCQNIVRFQPFGEIKIDSANLMYTYDTQHLTNKIHLKMTTDVVSGNSTLFIKCPNTNWTQIATGGISVNIPIAYSSDESWNIMMNGWKNVGNMFLTEYKSGGSGVGAFNTLIENSLAPFTQQPSLSSVGGNNGSTIQDVPTLYQQYRTPLPYAESIFGKPLQQMKQLKNIYGFTICKDFHLEGISTGLPNFYYATSVELDEIERLLKTGVILHHYTT